MPFHRYVIGHPGFWARVGWFLPLVVFALLLALAAFAVVRLMERGPQPSGPPPSPAHGGADAALNQVRYRYASGQLSREDYFRLMADLGGAPPYGAAPPPPPAPAPAAATPPSGEAPGD